MILTCPSCGTRYQTDIAHFKTPGRNVRCAKCGEVWYQAAPELSAEAEPEAALLPPSPTLATPSGSERAVTAAPPLGFAPAASSVKDFPPESAPRRSRGGMLAHLTGWAALVLILAAAGWGTIHYREAIVAVWPQSASFYSTIGMPVKLPGVTLMDISYSQAFEDGQPILSVTGKVVNGSNREMPVPDIRVVLLDEQQRELYRWTFNAGVATLMPGAQSPFMTRLASPPAAARNLNVLFVESGEPR